MSYRIQEFLFYALCGVGAFFIFAIGFVWGTMSQANQTLALSSGTPPEPDHCYLCGSGNGVAYHAPHMDYTRYCGDCRALIQAAAHEGDTYLLADLHDLDRIKTYPITPSTVTMRIYTIAITDDGVHYSLTVTAK